MISSPKKVAACVTLYNSTAACLKRIETYRTQVAVVYAIDNSDHPNPSLVNQLHQLSNVQYLNNGGNQGIAVALNLAAQQALANGFDYLLTMDDDTELPSDAVKKMLRFMDEQPNSRQIGIISGIHSPPETTQTFRTVPYTMTSGNLLNLSAYQQIGPFLDALFIDHVDHEFGLRLNRASYQIIELTNLHLKHQLGDRKKILGGAYTFVSHTPIRTYYIVRNGWVVARLFREFRLRATVLITKEWLKTLFFDDQKLLRFKMMWRGIVDGCAGRLGKLNG